MAKTESSTYMLHDPQDMSSTGKFKSKGPKSAALKAASKGVKQIVLRKTNSKELWEYTGECVELDPPKVVRRGGQDITYRRKPAVQFVCKTIYSGDKQLDLDPPSPS